MSLAEFQEFVDTLIRGGVLIDNELGAPHVLGHRGFADLSAHYSMLMDTQRVYAYQHAIETSVAGKHVLEIGCGTGILTLFALKAGARHVTVIEESAVADVAWEMFKAHGVTDRVTLLRGNSRDVQLDPPAEVLIHELFGTDPLGENVLPTLQDAQRRLLVPNALLLPDRLEVFCVGLRASQERAALIQKRIDTARDFSKLYGLDFTPFAEAYGSQLRRQENALPPSWNQQEVLRAHIMTEPAKVMDLSLSLPWAPPPKAVPMKANVAGTLGATLSYFTAHFGNRVQLSNAPHLPLTSWGFDLRMLPEEMEVLAGESLTLEAKVFKTLATEKLELQLRKSL